MPTTPPQTTQQEATELRASADEGDTRRGGWILVLVGVILVLTAIVLILF